MTTYFKNAVTSLTLLAVLLAPVSAFAEESKDVKELRMSIASIIDKIQKRIFSSDDVKPDIIITKHEKRDCVCKGTGRIIHGDGHSTSCPCNICGCNVKRDEPLIIVQPELQACTCTADESGTCSCENCECHPKVEAAPKQPEPVVKEETKATVEENSTSKIIMYGANWCSHCIDWERSHSADLVNKGWFYKKIDVDNLKDGESVPAWVTEYPAFSVTINGKTYNSTGKLPMERLRKYLSYESTTVR